MSNVSRKGAIKEFKTRNVAQGIFAVRCTVAGRVWIDSSPNLDAVWNSKFDGKLVSF